jgi:thioredoxin reductase (NADPH)
MEQKIYDLIIIGAGPAGLGASIYASRYKLDHLVIGSEIGGQVTEAWEIENYAGFEKISGKELMKNFQNQSEKLGGKIIQGHVSRIEKDQSLFKVIVEEGASYTAKTVILALGMKARKMELEGEDRLIGKGVSYCATCDAMFFRGKDVVVIGGGDAAATATIHLSEFANKVHMLYLTGGLMLEPVWKEKIEKISKVEMIECTKVTRILGDQKVEGIEYEINSEKKELPVQGIFIEIGSVPGVSIAHELGVKTDDHDYIIVDQTQATNVDQVFAAGDVTTGSNKFRQIITAVAEGAVAAGSVYRKLKLNK